MNNAPHICPRMTGAHFILFLFVGVAVRAGSPGTFADDRPINGVITDSRTEMRANPDFTVTAMQRIEITHPDGTKEIRMRALQPTVTRDANGKEVTGIVIRNQDMADDTGAHASSPSPGTLKAIRTIRRVNADGSVTIRSYMPQPDGTTKTITTTEPAPTKTH
jgi:hypothetical protein